ncbi:isochorismatase family protein [Xylanimonas allomyrinae]|uniref:isochorismatase family protein n=1 Tax=Xylanimonas allomyrinae TaxID=2509459 RepID=UPI001FE2A6FE|nr:isochorismatase family protein [Xylanimonas allomyrinae]
MPVTTLDPRTALVVVDLQAGIVGSPTEPFAASDVVARSAQLADAFRAHGLPVVLVHVTARADGADAVHGRSDATAAGAPQPARTAGWDVIVDALGGPTGKDGDIVVTKRNWGAFYGTDLDVQLRRRGITQVVITGIATSIGVESTARQAHEHGYHVTIATDAVTDRTAIDHEHAVTRIFPGWPRRGRPRRSWACSGPDRPLARPAGRTGKRPAPAAPVRQYATPICSRWCRACSISSTTASAKSAPEMCEPPSASARATSPPTR